MTKEEKLPEVKTKETLEKIPAWAQAIMAENDKLRRDLGMLKDLSGKNAIKSWEEQQKDHSVKFAKLKVWNGKTIVGWSDIDTSNYIPKARTSRAENLLITLFFEDGTEETINYVSFININQLIPVKILKYSTERIELEMENGEKKMIDTKFIN